MPIKPALLAGALLCAASMTSASAASIRLPEGPGVNLVYAKCQTCHDLQYLVDSKGLLPNQWRSVLEGMKGYGLTASEEEQRQLLDYLNTYMGPKPPPTAASATKHAAQADGPTVFAQNCASCHGVEGRGQPGYFPPLAGNSDLSKDVVFPVLVVLHGLSGPIKVDGATFNGSMPSFGHLSNSEIAAVINFVRAAWGNKPAVKAITPETVAEQRARSMTAEQVHAYRSGMSE